jgi:hypothetical protein
MDSSVNVRFIEISLTVKMQGNAKPGAFVRGLLSLVRVSGVV